MRSNEEPDSRSWTLLPQLGGEGRPEIEHHSEEHASGQPGIREWPVESSFSAGRIVIYVAVCLACGRQGGHRF